MSLRDLPSSPLYGDNSPFTIQTAKTKQDEASKTKPRIPAGTRCGGPYVQHLKADNFRISLWALPGRLSLGSPYMQNLKYSEWNLNCNSQSRRRIPGTAQTVTPLATPEGNLVNAPRRAYGGRKKSRVPFPSQILKGKHHKNYRIGWRDLPPSALCGDNLLCNTDEEIIPA